MSRQHTKKVRAQWKAMTESERDLANLRGLRSTYKIRSLAKDSGVARGAQRVLETLDREIARLECAPTHDGASTRSLAKDGALPEEEP